VAHDGSEGLSPDGSLPDRISVGVLTRVFTLELVDAAVEDAGAGTAGTGQVMTKLADGLYHQRRAGALLAGHQLDPGGWVDVGRWRPPNISSLSRGRGKLGPAPVRFLFEQVTGPVGDERDPGVFCCGLRIVSMDGSTSDVPDSEVNDEHFGRGGGRAVVDLGELVVGAVEADLESLDLAKPALAFGLSDAGDEIVADFRDARPLN
jgi:hypothetical protein